MTARRVLATAAGLLLLLGAGGCGRTTLEIQSDTCWQGTVNKTQIYLDGCGNKTYKFSSGFKCARLNKRTGEGTLRARIRKKQVWIETTVPYGAIDVCN
ncbi:MAG: hypothetical protein HZC42_12505 [Candidatus Eisenbacteria bacterium]|nr:hypothetical protein [Candidatus Eisenbacteria bacterium]